ncbi:protein of unknown function [Pararobbsia alpina]
MTSRAGTRGAEPVGAVAGLGSMLLTLTSADAESVVMAQLL